MLGPPQSWPLIFPPLPLDSVITASVYANSKLDTAHCSPGLGARGMDMQGQREERDKAPVEPMSAHTSLPHHSKRPIARPRVFHRVGRFLSATVFSHWERTRTAFTMYCCVLLKRYASLQRLVTLGVCQAGPCPLIRQLTFYQDSDTLLTA